MPSASELAEVLSPWGRVRSCREVGGGCISAAFEVTLDHERAGEPPGDRLFVKRNARSFLDNFQCEADGLRRLASVGAIGVPEPFQAAATQNHAWLVTAWIDTAGDRRKDAGFYETFGARLAELHRRTRGETIGLQHDNWLGAARQINRSMSTWNEFVQVNRLGVQLRWAVDQGHADTRLRQDIETIIERVPELLQGREEATSLLHGDLWSGNLLCSAAGDPVIVDPAVYYGCREAEFGMIRLFGGCPQAFYRAYEEVAPFPDGSHRRIDVYVLYHLLNHLNLFGSGYAASCRDVASRLLLR